MLIFFSIPEPEYDNKRYAYKKKTCSDNQLNILDWVKSLIIKRKERNFIIYNTVKTYIFKKGFGKDQKKNTEMTVFYCIINYEASVFSLY